MFIFNEFYPRTNHFLYDTFKTLEETLAETINTIKAEISDEELINELEKQLKNKELLYATEGIYFELTSEYNNNTIKVLIGPPHGAVVNPPKLQMAITVYYKERLDLSINLFTLD